MCTTRSYTRIIKKQDNIVHTTGRQQWTYYRQEARISQIVVGVNVDTTKTHEANRTNGLNGVLIHGIMGLKGT